MVFQHFELFPHLLLVENICLAQTKVLGRAREQSQQKAALMLDRVAREIKRVTQPMLGFKLFWSTRAIAAGIETMHMIKKGEIDCPDGKTAPAAQQFYSLAF